MKKNSVNSSSDQKQKTDKFLLSLEIVIGLCAILLIFASIAISQLVQTTTFLKTLIIVVGFAIFLALCFIALKIQQVAGYYKCNKCNHTFVPSYKQVLVAMHVGRTRYVKCPHCGKKSWCKKVLSKNNE